MDTINTTFIKYPLEEIIKNRRGRSENCLISDWRSKRLMSSMLENSIARRDWEDLEEESDMKMVRIDSSLENIKPIDRGVSEYWSNVLHYYWPIAYHGLFLMMIIFIVGPWIGLSCNEEDSLAITNDRFFLWRPIAALSSYSALKSSQKFSRGACSYRLYCTNKNTDGEPVRRRASFLKRKRNLKDLID
ncbi:uncharacterized protein [Chelonus insularis]|uniref:uncharacterized protein isoform X2 n=1 Tax=Chelonus insularis TaxID=460826 RepID=UPI00158CA503|nr:uncharacterized protein LOC118064595 isoform X2 [Chelonus insularis]